MGQCYAVSLRYKIKDEKKLVKALNRFIDEHEGKDCRFNLDMWGEGFDRSKFDNLVRVFFSNAGCYNQVHWGTLVKAPEGLTIERCKEEKIPYYLKYETQYDTISKKYKQHDVLWIKAPKDSEGFSWLGSGFDASYGWESVMEKAFEVMAKYLEDGSEMDLDMDECARDFRVVGGKVVEDAESLDDME